MEPIEYLRGLERRWKAILLCLLVALTAGWIFTLEDDEPGSPATSVKATTHLISSSTLSSLSAAFRGPTNLETIAALITLGEVPRRVAETLDYQGDPGALAQNIEVVGDPATGLLSIAATAPTERRAILLANTFAEELMGYLHDRNLELVRSLQDEIGLLDGQIAELDRQLALASDEDEDVILEERELLDFRRQTLVAQYSQLATATGGNPSGFEILERATATPVSPDASLAPRSRTVRLLIAGIVGLILGVAVALLLERFDARIHSKDAAENAFKLPVLGEIPVIPRRRRRSVVAGDFPNAPASNSFRLLTATLQFGRRGGVVESDSGNGDRAWRTILVTSAAPTEGKSTTVANLAATFDKLGKRVIVLCCDFRHPSLHVTFGIDQGPGLSEILAPDGAVELKGVLQETTLENVRVLSTGSVPENTSALFGSKRMRDVLADARAIADIVLIDTAPVLASSDWAQLLPHVEAVLVVARAGKTGADAAERTAEILSTLQAPVVGVVLNRVPRSLIGTGRYSLGFGYGGYGGYGDKREASTPAPTPASEDGMGVADVNGPGGQTEGEPDPSNPRGGIPHLVRPSTEE